MAAKSERLAFIDWMKALGMLLIVYGHSRAGTNLFSLEPIYEKQLGVVFFVFVCGFSLARERRPAKKAVLKRLFSVFLFGIGFALVMSVVGLLTTGGLALSNYLPFVFGSNVLLNNFPANPTTWYIGTYLHLLVLWAVLLRRMRVTWKLVIVSIFFGIAVRAALLTIKYDFVAYMLITNWLTVFLLGILYGQRSINTNLSIKSKFDWIGIILVAIALFGIWPKVTQGLNFDSGVPFSNLCLESGLSPWANSIAVELIYLAAAWLFFRVTLWLPRSRVVEFFARNTLIIFILHMPLVLALSPYVGMVEYPWLRVLINIMVYFVLLGCFSELLQYLVQPKRMMDWVFGWFDKKPPSSR